MTVAPQGSLVRCSDDGQDGSARQSPVARVDTAPRRRRRDVQRGRARGRGRWGARGGESASARIARPRRAVGGDGVVVAIRVQGADPEGHHQARDDHGDPDQEAPPVTDLAWGGHWRSFAVVSSDTQQTPMAAIALTGAPAGVSTVASNLRGRDRASSGAAPPDPIAGRLAGGRTAGRSRGALVTDVDPVLLEIVEGTLASIEAEVEDQIGRTSRSPMIRDQHDFRAGIHDRRLRKLTGRSYSALVHPVVRDFPIETMRPGDVYFHNDVYLSEGGIGHLPDLCVTVPVFHDGEVVAFVQAFGHHDDIGGAGPRPVAAPPPPGFAGG